MRDDLVRGSVYRIPLTARYAVVTGDPTIAEAQYHVRSTTLDAIGPLSQEILLPRRQVATPAKGTYIVCFLCDTSAWDKRTHWVWTSSPGVSQVALIGLVYR